MTDRSTITIFVNLLLLVVIYAYPVSANETQALCYLPSENNVSYSSVLELPSPAATKILKYGEDPLQFGELWLPMKNLAVQPLIVLIHGGCWLNEYDVKHTNALSSSLAASGYAVWAIEYRRIGDAGGGWPGSLDDIKKGIQFTQTLEPHSLDLENIVIVGHSAGGHLALLAGADAELVQNANISGVIGLAAITNLEKYAEGENDCQTAALKFMGDAAADNEPHYAPANPANQQLHPNTLLLHGMQDKIVPIKQATESGVDFQMIEGAGHFDMIHPATPSYQTLLKHLAQFF